MFESFYHSYYHHPLLLWVAPLLFLFLLGKAQGAFRHYLVWFTALTLLDPLMTGPFVQFFSLGEGPSNAIMIFFVILGDLRFFYLIERFSRQEDNGSEGGHWLVFRRALAWSFVVPLAQFILIASFPRFFEEARMTFLVYELLFLIVAGYFRVSLGSKELDEPSLNWLKSACSYAMLYYALWASVDVLILAAGSSSPRLYDWGFALRVIPNLLYYSLFLPFVFFRAPQQWVLRKGTDQ